MTAPSGSGPPKSGFPITGPSVIGPPTPAPRLIIDVLTLFPDTFGSFLSQSLLAKALAKGLLAVNLHDVRARALDRHRTCDDRPYGGGPGMVLKPEPLAATLDELLSAAAERPHVVNLAPSGRPLDQDLVRELAARPRIALICGRYEGIDQRVLDTYADESISIGDYVLSGGEVPAMVVIEAVARLLPGFMGSPDSPLEESHGYGLLEHPLYTRPRVWRGLAVPEILLSGDHAQVAAWRLAEAVARTRAVRPELLERPDLADRVEAVLGRPGAPLRTRPPGGRPARGRGREERTGSGDPPGVPAGQDVSGDGSGNKPADDPPGEDLDGSGSGSENG